MTTPISQLYPATPLLPARKDVTEAYPSLTRLYQDLKTSSVSTMVAAKTPTLAKIKKSASETEARALLYIALCELADFFNVGKNMRDTQIALTVDLILESFWYFKLEEIKYCFRRAMMREKLFDRLDGNIIIGWLREYDAERTDEAMRISEQEESEKFNNVVPGVGAMSWAEYHDRLKSAAASGDAEAMAKIAEFNDLRSSNKKKVLTKEQKHEKEVGFKQYFYNEYLKNKK